ncbi:MAG: DUF309 domain-containing protein [Thermomicrobiales bacterium]
MGVDSPQESTGARIVPFPQPTAEGRPQPRTTPRIGTPGRTGETITSDQLLDMIALAEPLPGENEGLTHLRAVSIGVSSGAFYPHTATEDVPAAAARLGIGSVELMLQTAGEYEPEFIAQVKANAEAAGVRIHALHTMFNLHPMLDRYPRRATEGRALFQKGIEAAAALGAKALVWHGARKQDVANTEGWERFIALTAELATACGQHGVTLALENVSWCALAQVRHVVTFATRLEEIGTPEEVGFVFDPFQAVEAGANPFMMLAAMGNRVVDVHISDYHQHDITARHLPPGDGDLPWSALIRAIAGSGYTGPMMIEGPLGTDDEVIGRVRGHLDPLIRSIFPFRPEGELREDALSGADRESESVQVLSTVTPPLGIRRGIDLFNARQFYEQHEAIEHEWHAERGPIRRLYQGILQIGVGFHHALNGNHKGAVLLLHAGIEKTRDFEPQALGIDTATLVVESQACLDRIDALGPNRLHEFDPAMIPTIAYTAS